jgi:hypothetical protein
VNTARTYPCRECGVPIVYDRPKGGRPRLRCAMCTSTPATNPEWLRALRKSAALLQRQIEAAGDLMTPEELEWDRQRLADYRAVIARAERSPHELVVREDGVTTFRARVEGNG